MRPPAPTQIDIPKDAVRVLHLEDSRGDRDLVASMLAEEGIVCEISPAESRDEFVKAVLTESWDLILSDYSLPSFDGFRALEIAKQATPNTPFIFLTGTLGEDIVVETLKSGATDYVLKQKMARLGTAVRRALNERADKVAREKAEASARQSEEQLRYLAYHDALTGLPNRAFLQDNLGRKLATATRRKEKIALLFIDLDHFKDVNDSLGHSVGDFVLQEVARRLRICSREHDMVVRLGGDEFLIVLSAVNDSSDAAVAAARINNILARDIQAPKHQISLSASIGISVFPDDGREVESLIREADLALYAAKDNGRNTWRFFTGDMNVKAKERVTMESELRHAAHEGQLFLEYQPQVSLSTRRIIGSEALLRWRHPDLGLVSPDRFIPAAERCGAIIQIGEWVLRTACAQARIWQDEGPTTLPVAVNVSAVQFRDPCFPGTVKNVLSQTGLSPSQLELELTEGVLFSDKDVAISTIKQLREIGVKFAIDDFGTGYSGLSYLRHFRANKLKIDRSFVKCVTEDSDDAAMTAAIIGIGKVLQMTVIAEGVETEQQMRFLREHDCDEVQGFYFSRPLSAHDFAVRCKSQQQPLMAEQTIGV